MHVCVHIWIYHVARVEVKGQLSRVGSLPCYSWGFAAIVLVCWVISLTLKSWFWTFTSFCFANTSAMNDFKPKWICWSTQLGTSVYGWLCPAAQMHYSEPSFETSFSNVFSYHFFDRSLGSHNTELGYDGHGIYIPSLPQGSTHLPPPASTLPPAQLLSFADWLSLKWCCSQHHTF